MVFALGAVLLLPGWGVQAAASATPEKVPDLSLGSASVAFGTVPVNTRMTKSLTIESSGTGALTISSASIKGSGFSVSGLTFPLTLASGAKATLNISYDPAAAVVSAGTFTITSDASSGKVKTVSLSGTGTGVLNALTCSSAAMTGAGSDSCLVSMTAGAARGAVLRLLSSDAAVQVPSSITIPAGGISAKFNAAVSAVSSSQTATVTATWGSISRSIMVRLNAVHPQLSISPLPLSFGNVLVDAADTKSVTLASTGMAPVTISRAAISGGAFSFSGLGLPRTLNPGEKAVVAVKFNPSSQGLKNGALTITSNSSTAPTTQIVLSGTGLANPSLTGISCSSDSVLGSDSDLCRVNLSQPTGSGGAAVLLASSRPAITLPSSVLVPAGSSSATFTAKIAAVTTAQNALLTATMKGITKTVAIQLKAAIPQLTAGSTSLAFGDVTVTTAKAETLRLTSSGTAALTITSATIAGAGYSVSGGRFPLTLNPGASATLSVNFDPTTSGAVAGSLHISSNSKTGGQISIALSGTGTSASLTQVSCSSDSVIGSASDLCKVNLSQATGRGGAAVLLTSSRPAVTLPSSVLVPAGSSSATFTANIAAVTTAQNAVVSAALKGVSKSLAIQLKAATPQLTVGSTGLAFGDVTVTTAKAESLKLISSGYAPLTIASATVAGTGYSVSGAKFPLTLNPGASAMLSVNFDPTTSGAVEGSLHISSNSTTGGQVSIPLSGTGMAPGVLSGASCGSTTVSGAGTDACTVSLTEAAASAVTVRLTSSSGALRVPPSVTIPAGAKSVNFSASASAVSAVQTATIRGTSGTISVSCSVQLDPETRVLSLQSTSVSFGTVALNSTATQTVKLTSTGTSAVTITAAGVAGQGFSLSGLTLPLTLNPGQAATVDLEFHPTTAGSVTGALTLTSNATSGGTALISLSGTGPAAVYQVSLSWQAPSNSPVAIAGYNIYRGVSGSSSYTKLVSLEPNVTYQDSTVSSGTSYLYVVTSVDTSGVESDPSNTFSVTIP